jgi:hypothetical protein
MSAMPLPVVVVAFDPGCQQTPPVISRHRIRWDRLRRRALESRVHRTPAAPVVIRSFGDVKDAEAEDR